MAACMLANEIKVASGERNEGAEEKKIAQIEQITTVYKDDTMCSENCGGHGNVKWVMVWLCSSKAYYTRYKLVRSDKDVDKESIGEG